MLLPSIFGENLFDDFFDDVPFFDNRAENQIEKKLYGRHAHNVMKTDIKETDDNYELIVDLPGFKKDEIKVSLVICRCSQAPNGKNRWRIQLDASLMPDITIAVRMDANNRDILDYYLIPALDVEDPQIRLVENNHFALDAYRFDSLQTFFMLAERVTLAEAA